MDQSSIYPKTLREILNDSTEPPTPIVNDGLLLNGTILIIVGPPKSKKTFICQNLALSIAAGEDFAGFSIPKPKKVLYSLAEGGYYPNRDRLQKMAKNMPEKALDNFMMSTFSYLPLDEQEPYERMKSLIEQSKPKVLIFDPLIRFHNADENSASQMSEVFGRLRKLIDDYGISIILIHHTGKVESKGGRGTSAIMGEYDSCITLHTVNKNITRLNYDMRHVETPPSNQILFDSNTLWFGNNNPVVDCLQKNGGCMDKKDFFKTYGKPKSTSYKHLKSAVEVGTVSEVDDLLQIV